VAGTIAYLSCVRRRRVRPCVCVIDRKQHIRTFLCDALEELGFITRECNRAAYEDFTRVPRSRDSPCDSETSGASALMDRFFRACVRWLESSPQMGAATDCDFALVEPLLTVLTVF
jgi:hypothetical protein